VPADVEPGRPVRAPAQPAHYFTDITSTSCKANDLPYAALATDLANHTVPGFLVHHPNLNDDMHNGSVAAGDTWLSTHLPALLGSTEYTSGSMVIFLMWDEGSGGGTLKGTDCTTSADKSCHVPLIVISP